MADENEETGLAPEVIDAPAADAPPPPEPEEAREPEPVEELAREIGWTPREDFRGDPGAWKPASEFIKAGRDIQRNLSRDVQELKSNIANMSRTSATLLQQQLADRDAYWEAQHRDAIEQGDVSAANYANQQRGAVAEQYQQVTRPVITSEAAEFAERNRSWFQRDPLATRRAFEVTETYAQAGKSASEQLEAAERQVRKEFPELFERAKPQANVNTQSSRTATTSGRNKGLHDMPAEAQAVARDMVERGVIPSVDVYVSNYFNQKRVG